MYSSIKPISNCHNSHPIPLALADGWDCLDDARDVARACFDRVLGAGMTLPARRNKPGRCPELSRSHVSVSHVSLRCDGIDLKPVLESLGLNLSNITTWTYIGAIVLERCPILCIIFLRLQVEVEEK